jgi:predicted nucleic acid-binding protein
MIVVSNTSPIISLSSINQIELLKKLFGKVYIPQAVYNEIKSKTSFGYNEVDQDLFKIEKIKDRLAVNILLNDLDLGEAETIVLSKELDASIILIDEKIGYDIAKSQDLNVERTLSLLIAAKQKGYILHIKPLLDEMINKNRWISKKIYRKVLMFCDELD